MENPDENNFNASRSFSPVGKIASYRWDFGDGQTTTCYTPTICHTYTRPGRYTVTLIVTNTAGTSTETVFTGQTAYRNGNSCAVKTKSIDVETGLFLPRNLKAHREIEDGSVKTTILWNAPCTGKMPSSYLIYRDASLKSFVAEVPACGELEYTDIGESQEYFIVSAGCCGVISRPACIKVEFEAGNRG